MQLIAAAKGRPIPAPDEIPEEEEAKSKSSPDPDAKSTLSNLNNLMVPISSRSQSFNSDTSSITSPSRSTFPVENAPVTSTTTSIGSALSRGRAKTLASLTGGKSLPGDITPREINLPKDPYVSGQPIEAYLYKDASECPICFLYYPPYLNKTRCCDQAICSECFVQIKRPDPHPPEHSDPSAPPPISEIPDVERLEGELVSEPAACPFCVQPEFGITYEQPPFRRGLTYANQATSHTLNASSSAMSSSSSLGSALSNGGRLSPTNVARRRTTSISATSPMVITTDRVRPDWATKLAAARAHTARRSAAATALHTAAYLMGNREHQTDGRSFGAFGRRGLLRRGSGADSPLAANGSPHLNMLALMSERYTAQAGPRADNDTFSEGGPSTELMPRGSSRRGRMEDLEDMMMMEAIRLSLASEEERRKREEKDAKKDAKKEAKKKEKANKKAEKVARKTGFYPGSTNASSAGLNSSQSDLGIGEAISTPGKGKVSAHPGIENLPAVDPQAHLQRARAQVDGSSSYGPTPYRPSHLRTLSNASSSASSLDGSAPGSLRDPREPSSSMEATPQPSGIAIPMHGSSEPNVSGTPSSSGAGLEPMFNFQSLAAMIGHDEKVGQTSHIEQAESGQPSDPQRVGDFVTPQPPSEQEVEDTERINHGFIFHDDNESRGSDLHPPDLKITASSQTNSNIERETTESINNYPNR